MSEEQKENINFTPDNVQLYVQPYMMGPIRRLAPKMKRNDICSVNNTKFKKCCGSDGSNYCKKLLADYLNDIQTQNKSIDDQSS